MPHFPWEWDETIQRGTDYADVDEVRAYDERMRELRDVRAEADRILDRLQLSQDDVILEVGTGTGAFAREAARRCRMVIALDVSPVMLAYARERAASEGIANIEFREAGFLSYEHGGEASLAAAVSQLALHHLPDAWKLVALQRLAQVLRPGGRLFLTDVVLPDEAGTDPTAYFRRLTDSIAEGSRLEMARHIRQEFSTYDWIMRGLIERAGFRLEEAGSDGLFLSHYLAQRG